MKLFLGAVLLATVIGACSNDSHSGGSDANRDLDLYKQAIAYDDYFTAINAIQSLLLKDSTQTQYVDTLANLYFKAEMYSAAMKASQKILEKRPDDVKIMEIAIKSAEGIGSFEYMMMYAKRLLELTKHQKYNYHLARMYLSKRDMDSVNYYLNAVLSSPANLTDSVDYPRENGMPAKTPVKAVVLVTKGGIMFNEGKVNEAAKYFIEALKVDPEFEMAKQGLQTIQEATQRR